MNNEIISYIAPVRNLNFKWRNKDNYDINKIFDDEYQIELRLFSYHDDIENIHADVFSTHDRSSLNFHPYAFYFRCKREEVGDRKMLINLILLAFRIFKESDCVSNYVLCLTDTDYSIKYNEPWKTTFANLESTLTLNEIDLDFVIESYKKLKSFNSISNRTRHSIQFLFLSYTAHYWMSAYILLMTSLETLVSPSTEEKITARIIKRTRNLINDANICSKNKLEKLYKLRSNIIHGRIIVDLNFKDHIEDMVKLQNIVLSAFKIILSNNYISTYENEESKEEFFLNLEN